MRYKAIIFTLVAAFLTVPALAGSKSGLFEAIHSIESEEGALSMKLYQPLQELGLQLLASGDYENALDTFRRMQHLLHRSYGVHAPEQIESIDLIIRSYAGLGDYQEIDRQQHFAYDIARRAFAEDDLRMLQAQARLARWYRNTARYDEALALYEAATEALPEDDLKRRAAVLRAEALTYYLAGKCCASEKLAQIATLAESSDQFDFQEKREAALNYADMLMMERAHRDAPGAYAVALDLAGQAIDATMLGLRHPRAVTNAIVNATMAFSPARTIIDIPNEGASLFANSNPLPASIGNPVPICSATVEEVLRSASSTNLEGYFIDVDVEIDDRGRARSIETAGNAPASLSRYVKSVLAETRYRPGTNEQGLASRSRLSFRQTFSVDDRVEMTDDLSGWNALLTKQTCQMVEKHGFNVMNASASAD